MSDLISRSALLKRLEEWNTSDETDKALYNFALHRIIEQPTAYSVDQVVEELEKQRNIIFQDTDSEIKIVRANAWDKIDVLNKAIEIVKQGCVSE